MNVVFCRLDLSTAFVTSLFRVKIQCLLHALAEPTEIPYQTQALHILLSMRHYLG